MRTMVGADLPFESDLTRWFPMWDMPVADMSDTVDRHILLEGAVNFRDLGGYPAGDGTRTRWRRLFRADGLGELTADDLEVVRTLGIRTVIDLRSEFELERSRFDVDAHPVAFHHFPFVDQLPDAEDFERRPGFLGAQYLAIARSAGPQIRRRTRGPGRSRRTPCRLPLHGRQGPHRRALRRGAVAARRRRADCGGRLRAQCGGHGAPAGQAPPPVPRCAGRPSPRSTRSSRPRRRRWRCFSTTSGSTTAPWRPTWRSWARPHGVVEALRAALVEPIDDAVGASRSVVLSDIGAQAVDRPGQRQVENGQTTRQSGWSGRRRTGSTGCRCRGGGRPPRPPGRRH